jgi:hypothetical protein
MSIQITDAIMVQGNKSLLGLGYQVSSNFSVGADAQYNFGKIETSIEFISGILLVLARVTRLIYQVLILMLAQCTKQLNSKLNVYSSLNYASEHPDISNTRNIATVAYNLGFDLAVVDVVESKKQC